jgi:hypothetical protein
MKAKTFDCVEMKHRGAEKVREQINGMAPEQELAFWRERSRILRQRQEAAKGGHSALEKGESQRSS